MSSAFLQEELAQLDQLLTAGAVVLTPNYSSSMLLQNNWCKYALARQNTRIIATPAVMAIDLWFDNLWQELALSINAPELGWQVLGPAQELLLWRRIIRASDAGAALLNIDGTAENTREALRLLRQWQIELEELRNHVQRSEYGGTPDDREVFLQWAQGFVDLCRSKKVLTFSDMLAALLELAGNHAEAFAAAMPRQILLWGFTDPPPLYQALFDKFAALGVEIKSWAPPDSSPATGIVMCMQQDEECRAAVEWAAATFRTNPDAAIGIVCADMQATAPKLERMLAQTVGTGTPNLLYSCPVNQNLAVQPFVATAMQIMELDQDHCDTLMLCQLLRSPWLRGAEEEADARAALELYLRNQGELVTNLAAFREACLRSEHPSCCPILGAALLQLAQRKRPAQQHQTGGSWLQWWQQQWLALLDEERLLATGNRTLARAWHNLQTEMQRMGFLLPTGTALEARAIFGVLAQETRLAITNTAAPIQVTGPVASAGMRFTHLWCMQMTEQHWPGAEQNNPWLPMSLQKKAGFPGSDPELVLKKARQVLQQLTAGTRNEVVFSYSAQAEEAPVRPSALLPAQSKLSVPEFDVPALHPVIHHFANELELFLDTAALPLSSEVQHSGSGAVLADQASCPFRAFALHRLKVRELPEIQFGLPASAVGECIHGALQNFWQVMQNSARLHAADTAELTGHVEAAVRTALRTVARRYPHTMTPRYQELEQERLCKLLLDWLQVERTRGHFSVLGNEEKLAWRFANLTLNLRIDRIDRNEDGSVTVVDYKSGQKTATLWQEERPEKPQLLLYQVAVDAQNRHGPAAALLYAHVSIKERVYAGIGASDLALPGITYTAQKSVTLPTWELLKQHWQHSLQQLAQEFLDGRLVVAPLSRTTCDYCHLHSFCRIGERRRLA